MTGTRPLSQSAPNGYSVTNVFSIQAGRQVTRPVDRHWWHSVEARLQELIRLEDGWDGYAGQPVNFGNAVFALRVLESTCKSETPPPEIVPGTSGDLQLEWHLPKGEIELHVHAPNDVSAWRLISGTALMEEQASLTTDFSLVAKWIRELTEASLAPRAAAA